MAGDPGSSQALAPARHGAGRHGPAAKPRAGATDPAAPRCHPGSGAEAREPDLKPPGSRTEPVNLNPRPTAPEIRL